MRRSSSNKNNSNISINSSNSSSGISRKPTSALSKIGKHVPPPISPMVAFKSTSSVSTSVNASNKSSLNPEKVEQQTVTTSGSTCAWRIPKATETQSANNFASYPQRKVPELPGAVNVVAVKEPEKPKSFLERFEEFPNLQKQTPATTGTAGTSNSCATVSKLAPPRPPQKLLIGDFNFLEDDDWLEGDNIDYSQNLFEDDDHFLATLSKPAEIGSSDPLCHVKAKSLLAERSHSAKKKDIWKRTDPMESETPKAKIKILKRPEVVKPQSVEIKAEAREVVKTSETEADKLKAEGKLVKKFSTTLKLSTETVSKMSTEHVSKMSTGDVSKLSTESVSKMSTEHVSKMRTDHVSEKQLTQPPIEKSSKIKIVYSSASKTLQKNHL